MADANVQIKITADASNAKSQISGLKGTFTEFASMLSVVKQGAQVLGQAFDATVGQSMKLGQSVEDLSRMIGSTAEQSSQLIAVTKMLGMSQESVSQAMLGAIRKGFAPTIDGLAAISDKYLSIQDPIERTKYLLDTFGRSGATMGELMEKGSQGIKSLGDQANLLAPILSEKDVAASKALGVELQSLGIAAGKVGVIIGQALTPTLNSAATAGVQVTEVWGMMHQAVTDGVATQLQMNAAVAAFVMGSPAMLYAILQQDAAFRGASQSANDVGTAIRNIPSAKNVLITVTTIQQTQQSDANAYYAEKLRSEALNQAYGLETGQTRSNTGGPRAIGGPLGSGVHLVGEEGPELIIGGNVIRASVTRMLSKGLGGIMGHALDIGGGGGGGGGSVLTAIAKAKHEAGGGSLFWEQTPAYLNNVNAPPGWGPNQGGGGGGSSAQSSAAASIATQAVKAAVTAVPAAVAQGSRVAAENAASVARENQQATLRQNRTLAEIRDILLAQGTATDIGNKVAGAMAFVDLGY